MMKITYLVIAYLFMSCNSHNLERVSTPQSFDFEQWQSKLLTKIETERKELVDSLLIIEPFYQSLTEYVKQINKDNILARHLTALNKLGDIPPAAETYFIEYFLQGETSKLNYCLFWIKDGNCKGVKQDENGQWSQIEGNCAFLKKLIEWRTDWQRQLRAFEGYILLTQFEKEKTIEVDFVLSPSIHQINQIDKLFYENKPFRLD